MHLTKQESPQCIASAFSERAATCDGCDSLGDAALHGYNASVRNNSFPSPCLALKRIRCLCAFALTIFATGGVALAGIDFDATENGMADTSGARNQPGSYGLSGLVLNANNRLVAPAVPYDSIQPIDAHQGLAARDRQLPIGFLIPGPQGTRITYDRLVAQPVLQILGYDKAQPASEIMPTRILPTQRQPVFADRGFSSPRTTRSEPPPTNPPVIPEPSSLGILLAGGAVLLRRPARPAA